MVSKRVSSSSARQSERSARGLDVVRHRRPQARRRHPGVAAGLVDHAHDAGRALVGRGREPELIGQIAVGRPRHRHRPGVGRVGQEAAERHDELGAALARDLEDAARVVLPAVLRLDADHHRDVVAARQRAPGEGVLRPCHAPRVVLAERDDRADFLEIVELVGVELAELLRSQLLAQEERAQRGRLAAVVPAVERAHEHALAQSRPCGPDEAFHACSVGARRLGDLYRPACAADGESPYTA